MRFINCEMNLNLNWSKKWVIVGTDVTSQSAILSITYPKLLCPVVILSTQDDAEMLEQLKPGIKRTLNWNKINQNNQQKDRINN